MDLSPSALLNAVSVKLREAQSEHAQLDARVIALTERVDDYGNVIRAPGPAGPAGIPGAAGRDGIDGANGREGIDGRPGEPGRDGRDGLAGIAGRDGERGPLGERGEQGLQGPPGPAGERGEAGPIGPAAYPGRAHGLYSEAVGPKIRAMDVVTFNGSEWRAVRDDPGPLPGDGWMLGAKGQRGKPGDRGPAGPPGPSGPGIVDVVLADWSLVLMHADGSAVSCDLSPLFERIRQEFTS